MMTDHTTLVSFSMLRLDHGVAWREGVTLGLDTWIGHRNGTVRVEMEVEKMGGKRRVTSGWP
jgi:hypothetical protein